MSVLKSDLLRSIAVGFALGTALVVVALGSGDASPLAGSMVTEAQAAVPGQ